MIKNGDNTGVVIKVHEGMLGLSDLYEIRWLKTNTVTNLTKTIIDMMGMEVIYEGR